MIIYNKQLVALLNTTGYPVYFEQWKEKAGVPCISYMESNNATLYKGDTLNYSTLSYLIKVWARDLEDIEEISKDIDDKLLANGFKRTSANEMLDGDLICKLLRYEAIGYEKQEE